MFKNNMSGELEIRLKELESKLLELEKAREKQREVEESLYQIIQGTPLATFVIDKEHRITHCNQAFENLYNVRAQDLIGTKKQWSIIYSKERPVMADLIVDNASEETLKELYGHSCRKSKVRKGAYEAEEFFPTLGEKGKWLYFTAAPLRDGDGNVTGAIETLQDITERRSAEESRRRSQRRLSILLDFVPYSIAIFTFDGHVYYVNPAFTDTFGWTLEELEGKKIPYVPRGLEQQTRDGIKRLMKEKILTGYETKRLTKDGQVLDVIMRAAVYPEIKDEPAGQLLIIRDITKEKRIARNNDAMLRISTALPEYPDLEELLEYINGEVKTLLGVEGAAVLLLDEERKEFVAISPVYDDTITQQRVKKLRLPIDKVVAGKTIKTGEPVIISEPQSQKERELYRERDEKLGYQTRNLLSVPLKSSDRILGVISALNKKEGNFDNEDIELLNMIAGTTALSIENARATEELKREYRTNETLLRISNALPQYPDLEELLKYISDEIRQFFGTKGAVVILLDEEKQEFLFHTVSFDDAETEKRMKESRFQIHELIAGDVLKSGKPLIVKDAAKEHERYKVRDEILGFLPKNFLLVPIRRSDRNIGVISLPHKKDGDFDERDAELLSMISGTVALSIENARFSHDLKNAYREVTSLNRAKDKVISHLSHELKTPVAILSGSLHILERSLKSLPKENWGPSFERAKRSLGRIIDIQGEAADIMLNRGYAMYGLFSMLLDQFSDVLETILAEEGGEEKGVELVRDRVEELFGTKQLDPVDISLDSFLDKRLEELELQFEHRRLHIVRTLDPTPMIRIPIDPLTKVVDGLVKNAVENTPNEGTIEVETKKENGGAVLIVRDFGVGITKDHQRRIFEGFFSTQETMDYSSKRPFDFNAGGKGADLLRMKIFSERYGFKIIMDSSRCKFLLQKGKDCPGSINECEDCSSEEDCAKAGGTTFSIYFPPAL